MKKALFIFYSCVPILLNAQSCPELTRFGVACFASGTDEFQKNPEPADFHTGARNASIQATYSGFDSTSQVAFEFAKSIWESLLIGSVPIKLNVFFVPAGASSGLLGITFPNGIKNFPGAIDTSTWYATSLANQIAGTELNPGVSDIDLILNSSMNWYLGTDGNCPVGKYDLVSVALHEMGHGFGFVGLSKVDGAGFGSFGLLEPSDFAVSPTFPWPNLDSLPGIFDRFLIQTPNVLLTSFSNPSIALAQAFAGNSIYWNGPIGTAFNGGMMPRIYAPSTFALGSSMVHLNESTYPNGNPNELMTPFASSHSSNHDPGPACMGMLKDIGWNVNYSEVEFLENKKTILTYPNPSTGMIHFALDDAINKIQLSDLNGRIIYEKENLNSTDFMLDLRSFAKGIYILTLINTKNYYTEKIIFQ